MKATTYFGKLSLVAEVGISRKRKKEPGEFAWLCD
jgi:hypothetical protein